MTPRARGLLLALVLFASPLSAQESSPALDSLRARWRIPVPEETSRLDGGFRSAPAMGANSPTAWGAAWGDVFVAASYTSRCRFCELPDGAVGFGFGLGNPAKTVGLEVDVISFSTERTGWFKYAGVDFKLHRLLPGNFAVAAGWEAAILKGLTDGGSSKYVAVSKWIPLADHDAAPLSALTLSAGAGNGRFRSQQAWAENRKTINAFGSVAVRALAPVSLIADWTGQDLALAMSLAPLRKVDVVLTPAFVDVTGSAGDGARFVLSGSLGLHF